MLACRFRPPLSCYDPAFSPFLFALRLSCSGMRMGRGTRDHRGRLRPGGRGAGRDRVAFVSKMNPAPPACRVGNNMWPVAFLLASPACHGTLTACRFRLPSPRPGLPFSRVMILQCSCVSMGWETRDHRGLLGPGGRGMRRGRVVSGRFWFKIKQP